MTAAALIAAMALLVSAAASPAAPPPIIGLPGCNTTCGDVSVPYPFGFGPSHCYWPGLNLTCDTSSHGTPRLLLGDGTVQVTEISLWNNTVRVFYPGSIVRAKGRGYGGFPSGQAWNVSFGRAFTDHGYMLSFRNEIVVSGCNVMATLLADFAGHSKTPRVVGGCASFCSHAGEDDDIDQVWPPMYRDTDWAEQPTESDHVRCKGTLGCCQAPLAHNSWPKRVEVKRIYSVADEVEEEAGVNVFVAEAGWVDDGGPSVDADSFQGAPLLLEWKLRRGLPRPQHNECPQDIGRMVCKSQHSSCYVRPSTRISASDPSTFDVPRNSTDGWNVVFGPPSYICQCDVGYDGNPYVAGGCQDINECEHPRDEFDTCFGHCANTMGSFDCRCPPGTYGNPFSRYGCVKNNFTTGSLIADAFMPTAAPTQMGLPNCNTTCGDVSVPYPFGISPGCYWPGFNLTCDSSQNPPQLHLDGYGSRLQVVDISLKNSTVLVRHTTDFSAADQLVYSMLPNIIEPYMLSTGNEFVFYGCNMSATLHGVYTNGSSSDSNTTDSIIARCDSTCTSGSGLDIDPNTWPLSLLTQTHDRHCSGHDGCCHVPIFAGSNPKKVSFKMLNNMNTTPADIAVGLISEEGSTDPLFTMITGEMLRKYVYLELPVVLRWAVKQDLLAHADNLVQCPGDIASHLCKSKHSNCTQENGGYTCHCSTGYEGNPYVTDGCQDIDECKITKIRDSCFGDCNNLPGHFECRCPRGTHGNQWKPRGCIDNPTGLVIGLSITSGPVLLFLVLGITLALRKYKQHKIKLLKKKYFKQNRGQLLQQLVCQNADIAERMIIPVDELAKATNNFDRARKLGGGGHGTVYKGILSDLHVVAIKKSNITIQKEIDEFINEVAILSQVNHKNVVKLFGCCLETEVPLLVYEFISNGTLYDHLHVEGPKALSWGNRLRIASEIATSLAYLHLSVLVPIIHRDIKSSNILLDDTLTSKVSDFGASRYIPIDKTGLTTRVQGTIGYLDPMYFYTSRLTEKSDVYSFGVMLVELLTRKKPFSYSSTDGEGLAAHFVSLFAEGNLVHIIDPQVTEEGGNEVQEVATLAASCVNIRGEERPTMRQVEHTLEALWGSKKYKNDDLAAAEIKNQGEGQLIMKSSRRYSLEHEMMVSMRYPR